MYVVISCMHIVYCCATYDNTTFTHNYWEILIKKDGSALIHKIKKK